MLVKVGHRRTEDGVSLRSGLGERLSRHAEECMKAAWLKHDNERFNMSADDEPRTTPALRADD